MGATECRASTGSARDRHLTQVLLAADADPDDQRATARTETNHYGTAPGDPSASPCRSGVGRSGGGGMTWWMCLASLGALAIAPAFAKEEQENGHEDEDDDPDE